MQSKIIIIFVLATVSLCADNVYVKNIPFSDQNLADKLLTIFKIKPQHASVIVGKTEYELGQSAGLISHPSSLQKAEIEDQEKSGVLRKVCSTKIDDGSLESALATELHALKHVDTEIFANAVVAHFCPDVDQPVESASLFTSLEKELKDLKSEIAALKSSQMTADADGTDKETQDDAASAHGGGFGTGDAANTATGDVSEVGYDITDDAGRDGSPLTHESPQSDGTGSGADGAATKASENAVPEQFELLPQLEGSQDAQTANEGHAEKGQSWATKAYRSCMAYSSYLPFGLAKKKCQEQAQPSGDVDKPVPKSLYARLYETLTAPFQKRYKDCMIYFSDKLKYAVTEAEKQCLDEAAKAQTEANLGK